MDQIKKLNPSFNPDDFEVTREARQRLAARLEDRGNSVTENPASDLMRRAREVSLCGFSPHRLLTNDNSPLIRRLVTCMAKLCLTID
jgi:hypothetical protein